MRAFLLSFLILASSFVLRACEQQRSPSRYLIPQGYVGWVRIDFNVNGAPQLRKEADYWNFKFPASGKIQTSSEMEYGTANDEYYYYVGESRSALKETGRGGGGMIWGGLNGKKEGKAQEVYQYFFVGTETQLREFGTKSKDQDGHPVVGNLNP